MFWKILLCTVSAAVLIFLFLCAKSWLLTPVRTGKNTRLTVTVTVTGAEPRLEETINSLVWLRGSGVLPCELVIADGGMDGDTRETAELLAKSGVCSLRGE